MKCENCGLDLHEYVNVGMGSAPVAIKCCEVAQLVYEDGMSLEDALTEIKVRTKTKARAEIKSRALWEAYKNSPDYLSKYDSDTDIPF